MRNIEINRCAMCVRKRRRRTRAPWNEVIRRALCHTRRKERGGTRKHANAGIIPCNYVQHTTHEDETMAERKHIHSVRVYLFSFNFPPTKWNLMFCEEIIVGCKLIYLLTSTTDTISMDLDMRDDVYLPFRKGLSTIKIVLHMRADRRLHYAANAELGEKDVVYFHNAGAIIIKCTRNLLRN